MKAIKYWNVLEDGYNFTNYELNRFCKLLEGTRKKTITWLSEFEWKKLIQYGRKSVLLNLKKRYLIIARKAILLIRNMQRDCEVV